MIDPAAEAAYRARSGDHDTPASQVHAEAGAREALKPIADWLSTIDSEDLIPGHVVIEALAPLVYTTEELESQ